jgi:hypothetical protein
LRTQIYVISDANANLSAAVVAPDAAVDSAVNHAIAPISSLVGRVGPLAPEITAASAERLGLREREIVVGSFKATAARLIPLE